MVSRLGRDGAFEMGVSLSRNLWLCLVLALTGVLLAWQLFVPPIIGLADQGDFVRMAGALGYAPESKAPDNKFSFVARKYVQDPSYRAPGWEQVTSEWILAKIAVTANAVLIGPKTFDITVFGFTHAVFFLLALARLLWVTRDLPMHGVAWAWMVLVLTDVGYVAYWNSLYSEPASCIWFLFFLAESIDLSKSERISIVQALRWNVFAVLWITAKTQNAALLVPLAAFDLRMMWRALDKRTRYAALAGVAAVCVAGAVMYRSLLPAPRVACLYNMVFSAILPESVTPQSDLRALGLNPDYARYSGTLAWSPGTGVADGSLVNAIEDHVSSFSLLEFYLVRPARLWRHVHARLHTALSLRPAYCGNFDKSAGRPPGARSDAIALWGFVHEHCLSPIAVLLLGAAVLFPAGGLAFLWRCRSTPSARRWVELAMLLAACCATAFFAAAFGDESADNIKHQFLFNLLLDTCLGFGLVAALQWLRRLSTNEERRSADSPQPN
ncbi:MAG: hypothetical protein ABSH42_11195 [Bryobacteraceae bacterium]|jgi:hypothetical protein